MTDVDPLTLGIIRDLARRVDDMDGRIRDQARASQARDRSVDEGSQALYDEDDELRAIVGAQPDGSYAITTFGGPAPNAPSQPLVSGFAGGATITWDGYDAYDEQGWPEDFARVTVHLNTIPEEVPPGDVDELLAWLNESQVASFESPAGGAVGITQPSDVATYCTLVAWTTAGVPSEQSVEVEVYGGGLPDTTPTEPPATSPVITATGLSDSIVLRSETVEVSSLIEYHMRESTGATFTPVAGDPATLVEIPTRSAVQIVSNTPSGALLDPNKIYQFAALATNVVGPATGGPSPAVEGKLDPDSVADIILARAILGLVMAGAIEVGQITIDPNTGITIPQPDGGVIVFPANGSVARITAELVARTLTLTGDASFNALVQLFSTMRIASGIVAPTSKPSMQASWTNQRVNALADSGFPNACHGLTDNAAGTHWFVALALFGGSVHRIDKVTGQSEFAWSLGSNFNPTGGIVRIGSLFYLCGTDSARSDDWYVYVYDANFVKQSEWFLWGAASIPKWASIGIDNAGGLLIGYSRADGSMRIREYSTSGTLGNTYDFAGPNGTTTYDVAFVTKQSTSFPASRFIVGTRSGPTYVLTSSTLVRQPTNEWLRAGGTWVHGMFFDGTRFWHLDNLGRIWKYANNNVATTTVYASAANYDGDSSAGSDTSNPPSDGPAGTHETPVGPVETFAWPARSFLTISQAPPTEAGVTDTAKKDKANRTRIYAGTSAATTAHRLQASLAIGVNAVTVEALETLTKVPETVNGFLGIGSAGQLETAGSDGAGPLALIRGDGFALFRHGAWTNLTLTGTWGNVSGQELSWWKDAAGNVHLRGIVTPGVSGTSCATLPIGARPAKGLRKSVEVLPAASATARCLIGSDGTITPTTNTGTPTQYYLDLEFPTQGA